MKIIQITLFILISIGTTRAQITITGTDLPSAGKGFVTHLDSTTNINLGTASSLLQNWDFSGLQNQGTKYAAYSENHPLIPYYSSFSQSNIYLYGYAGLFGGLTGGIPLYATNKGYTYMKSDSSGLEIVGFRNDQLFNNTPVLESPKEVLMKAPFAYDSAYAGNSKWSYLFSHNPGSWDTLFESNISKSLVADAFGSITTPYGTFDVIRIHENVIKNDSAKIIAMGSIYYSYPVFSETTNNYYFWAKNFGFPIAKVHCDESNNIKYVEYLSSVFPLFTLSGRVFSSDGITPINSGTISMILRDSYNHLFNFYETTLIHNDGYFRFSAMPYLSFLIYADPNPMQYPYHIPTYYGDEIKWQNAHSVLLNSDSSIVIKLQNDSLLLQNPGNGNLSGTIMPYSGQKSIALNADKVKVILEENAGGTTKAHAHTDSNGQYSISGIPNGSYKVYIEIPGLEMESHYIVNINNDTLNYENLNYYYDTLVIFVDPHYSIKTVTSEPEISVKVSPNPFHSEVSLIISGKKFIAYSIFISDALGRLVYSQTEKHEENIEIKNLVLENGVYYFKIILDENESISGKMVRY